MRLNEKYNADEKLCNIFRKFNETFWNSKFLQLKTFVLSNFLENIQTSVNKPHATTILSLQVVDPPFYPFPEVISVIVSKLNDKYEIFQIHWRQQDLMRMCYQMNKIKTAKIKKNKNLLNVDQAKFRNLTEKFESIASGLILAFNKLFCEFLNILLS